MYFEHNNPARASKYQHLLLGKDVVANLKKSTKDLKVHKFQTLIIYWNNTDQPNDWFILNKLNLAIASRLLVIFALRKPSLLSITTTSMTLEAWTSPSRLSDKTVTACGKIAMGHHEQESRFCLIGTRWWILNRPYGQFIHLPLHQKVVTPSSSAWLLIQEKTRMITCFETY